MRINASNFLRKELHGPDGRIGTIKDVLFDDDRWMVRYLVVAVDRGLFKRNVLVSPEFITETDDPVEVTTYLRKELISQCPRQEWLQPVSQQYKEALAEHFGTLTYSLGSLLLSPQRMMKLAPSEAWTFVDESKSTSLRSLKEMLQYQAVDRDGTVASLAAISINLQSWAADHGTLSFQVGRHDCSKEISLNRIRDIEWDKQMLRLDANITFNPFAGVNFEQSWGLSLTESAVF